MGWTTRVSIVVLAATLSVLNPLTMIRYEHGIVLGDRICHAGVYWGQSLEPYVHCGPLHIGRPKWIQD